MVVDARFAHLVQMASAGHMVRIVAGHSSVSGKTKVKVLYDATPGLVPPQLRLITMATLEAIRATASDFVVVDRGHRHSSGLSESHFWLQPPHAVAGGAMANQDCQSVQARSQAAKVPGTAPAVIATGAVTTSAVLAPLATVSTQHKDSTVDLQGQLRASPAVRLQPVSAPTGHIWSLEDTELLRQGLARHQHEIKSKLSVLSEEEMTDIESWVRAQFCHAASWDQKVLHAIRGIILEGMLRQLQSWLGTEVFALACPRPPSSRDG